jgi:hypothetical protein
VRAGLKRESGKFGACFLPCLYDSLMSSFHQLKAKRDKRHLAPHIKTSRSPEKAIESSPLKFGVIGKPGSGVLPDGIEVKTDEQRGRGLYATKAYKAGRFSYGFLGKLADRLGGSVLSTKPLQAVLSVPNLSTACSGCLLTPREIAIKTGRTRSLSPCQDCKLLKYCSDVSALK